MLQKLKQIASRNLVNIPGWRTDRKIVVFESDDWGSIRMPSKKVFDTFLDKGIPVDKSPYCKYDSLASESDLQALFEVLNKFEDSSGNPPVITANTVVANPDFEKIRASGFQKYYYELITDTFKKYPEHLDVFNLWVEGKDAGLFYPQSHGREHLNVPLWMNLLQSEHPDFLLAFDHSFWGLSRDIYSDMKQSIQAALDTEERSDLPFQIELIKEACMLFEKLFGYKSESFIANNYIWDSSLNKSLMEEGVAYLQGMKYQKTPLFTHGKRKLIRHHLGELNEFGQYYLIRNCTFEPSLMSPNFDNVGKCLKQISTAFSWNKPAIISTHRINYVGFLDKSNRKRSLELMSELLTQIVKNWPDVEFITSNKLGKMIDTQKKSTQFDLL